MANEHKTDSDKSQPVKLIKVFGPVQLLLKGKRLNQVHHYGEQQLLFLSRESAALFQTV
jgi:hypothetical protein